MIMRSNDFQKSHQTSIQQDLNKEMCNNISNIERVEYNPKSFR